MQPNQLVVMHCTTDDEHTESIDHLPEGENSAGS